MFMVAGGAQTAMCPACVCACKRVCEAAASRSDPGGLGTSCAATCLHHLCSKLALEQCSSSVTDRQTPDKAACCLCGYVIGPFLRHTCCVLFDCMGWCIEGRQPGPGLFTVLFRSGGVGCGCFQAFQQWPVTHTRLPSRTWGGMLTPNRSWGTSAPGQAQQMLTGLSNSMQLHNSSDQNPQALYA